MTVLSVYAAANDDTGVATAVFRAAVMKTLTDPRGWQRAGIRFTRAATPEQADLYILLGTNPTVNRLCGFDMMSCAWVSGKNSIINLERWLHGSDKSGLSLADYRSYVVNHETGHLLGLHDNMSQGTETVWAPVMVQHTLGPRGYRPNTRPRDDELAAIIKLGPARLQLNRTKEKKPSKKKSKKKSAKKKH